MPTNFENIVNAMGLINAALPSVVKVIVKLKGGEEVDLSELVADTQKIIDDKLAEAAEHLAKPGD